MYQAGEFYFNGTGIKQDYKKARKLFHSAAEKGHSLSITRLGQISMFGFGRNVDHFEAKARLEQAAESDCVDAMYFLGNLYWKTDNPLQEYRQGTVVFGKSRIAREH